MIVIFITEMFNIISPNLMIVDVDDVDVYSDKNHHRWIQVKGPMPVLNPKTTIWIT